MSTAVHAQGLNFIKIIRKRYYLEKNSVTGKYFYHREKNIELSYSVSTIQRQGCANIF